MNTVIGVYDSHKDAVSDIMILKAKDYDMENLSLLGKGGEEIIDEDFPETDKMETITKTPIRVETIASTTLIGTMVGLLTGAGLFFIPGLGILFGAGALVGAIAGFDVGLLGGGIASLLMAGGMKEEYGKCYEKMVNNGKHILIAHGTENDANYARDILHTHSVHLPIKQEEFS